MLYWDKNQLTHQKINDYARAIEETGGVRGIWGFIDGTLRIMCRLTENQKFWYSGYKKRHAFKFQAIMTPDGLVSHLGGPYEGKLGDWAAWYASGLEVLLRNLDEGVPQDQRAYLYGDPAYSSAYGITGAYKAPANAPLNVVLQAMNAHMSSLRISVEHGFGKTSALWQFNTHDRNLKMGLSPVAGYYMVSILITNIHTCLYGSQTSEKFQCNPLPLHVYLQP